MNRKTGIFFGPPLARLTATDGNTMEISGRLNRTAERYLEIIGNSALELSDAERACLSHICGIGFMAPQEIRELAMEVELTEFERDDLDKEALVKKLEQASFVELVATVEALGF